MFKLKNLLLLTALILATGIVTFAQTTAGGTNINNKARIAYTEPVNGGSVTGETPTYTVTVSNVAGLTITPDGGSAPSTTVGTTGILVPFSVCNTGNFAETISYPASGAAISTSGASATITRAVIDENGNGIIDAGDTNILTNGAVVAQTQAAGVCKTVLVELTANATGVIAVQLGDATGDNTPTNNSPGSLIASGGVNGGVEGVGDYGVTGGGITVLSAPAVLNGPNGNPTAVGPTSNNDDFQEATTTTGSAPAGSPTTASGSAVFQNTLQNQGGVADVYTLTAPTVPAGFIVEASADCSTYSTISGGGSLVLPSTAAGANQNYCVRVTAPAGVAAVDDFDTVIRATSGNNSAASNDTIDRLWTGFVTSSKTAVITNGTGLGGANDPVPGAVIRYTISYQNLSSTLTATNFVITEDGNAAPNNWATYTDHVAGSATDSLGGSISGDVAGSSLLTDTVASLAPSALGTFSFSRTIK